MPYETGRRGAKIWPRGNAAAVEGDKGPRFDPSLHMQPDRGPLRPSGDMLSLWRGGPLACSRSVCFASGQICFSLPLPHSHPVLSQPQRNQAILSSSCMAGVPDVALLGEGAQELGPSTVRALHFQSEVGLRSCTASALCCKPGSERLWATRAGGNAGKSTVLVRGVQKKATAVFEGLSGCTGRMGRGASKKVPCHHALLTHSSSWPCHLHHLCSQLLPSCDGIPEAEEQLSVVCAPLPSPFFGCQGGDAPS